MLDMKSVASSHRSSRNAEPAPRLLRLDGTMASLAKRDVDPSRHALVTYEGHNWLYLETDTPAAQALAYELQLAPDFGLYIRGGDAAEYGSLSPGFIDHLLKSFGFICLRNFPFRNKDDFVAYCRRFGEIYHWPFGPLHVVKPEDEPDGFVHSLEKAPLHWDLGLHPLDDENVRKNEWFCANKFMLYCKTPPRNGEGQTIVVSGRQVLRLAGSQQVERWRRVQITYSTRKTYFGGDPRTYPLVHTHPETGEPIFRYQEGSESELQSLRLHSHDIAADEFEAFVEEINRLAYDPRCIIAHDWNANDLLIVDNYLTLHGRLPMTEESRSRELWRVQTVLPAR